MYVDSIHNVTRRQNQLEVSAGTLDIGKYLVIPTSSGCRLENDITIIPSEQLESIFNRSCVMSIHCDHKYSFEEVPFDVSIYSVATILPIKNHGEQKDLFNDGSVILYIKSNGFSGNCYCVESRKKDLPPSCGHCC